MVSADAAAAVRSMKLPDPLSEGEKRQDFTFQLRIARALAPQKSIALLRRQFGRRMKQAIDLFPSLVIHALP